MAHVLVGVAVLLHARDAEREHAEQEEGRSGAYPTRRGGARCDAADPDREHDDRAVDHPAAREVRRVGDSKVRPVDVRVIAATNRDLRAEVQAGRFREDLYYRLAVVEVAVPTLRERIEEDFELLVRHMLESAPFPHGIRHVSEDVRKAFQEWHWPGNVRELRNVVLRAIPFSSTDTIQLGAIPEALRENPSVEATPVSGTAVPIPSSDLGLREAREQLMEAFERRYLEDLLDRSEQNLSKAARLAGVDRKTIARMLKRHDLK